MLVVYGCPGSEIFPPATAAALNPATPPLRHYHMNLDSAVDVKKVWKSRWNHFSPSAFTCICFLEDTSLILPLEFASELGVGLAVCVFARL